MENFKTISEMAIQNEWFAEDNEVEIPEISSLELSTEYKNIVEGFGDATADSFQIKRRGYQPIGLKADVSHRNVLNYAYDQGKVTACMSYAIAWMIQARMALRQIQPPSLSPQHLHFCSAGLGPTMGLNQIVAMHHIMTKGYPIYQGSPANWNCQSHPAQKFFKPKDNFVITTPIDLKYELAMFGPVAAYGLFYLPAFSKYKNGVYREPQLPQSAKAAHAICITGYDENLKAWEIVNSSGPNWGIGGKGYIGYGHCEILADINKNPLIAFDL